MDHVYVFHSSLNNVSINKSGLLRSSGVRWFVVFDVVFVHGTQHMGQIKGIYISGNVIIVVRLSDQRFLIFVSWTKVNIWHPVSLAQRLNQVETASAMVGKPYLPTSTCKMTNNHVVYYLFHRYKLQEASFTSLLISSAFVLI